MSSKTTKKMTIATGSMTKSERATWKGLAPDIIDMIDRYHSANGIDAPVWLGERPTPTGALLSEEKATLDRMVAAGILTFDQDELRYDLASSNKR